MGRGHPPKWSPTQARGLSLPRSPCPQHPPSQGFPDPLGPYLSPHHCDTGLGRDTGTDLPVVELPVHVDLPLGDETRQVGDGVGDVWGTSGCCEPQKCAWPPVRWPCPEPGGDQSSTAPGREAPPKTASNQTRFAFPSAAQTRHWRCALPRVPRVPCVTDRRWAW